MRARIVGLVALTAVVTSTLVERPSIVAATTAQVYVTGYVDRGYTASGVYTHPGTCAVDPRVIPLGTYITIDGIGTCHAEDTGGAVIGYHIDVWVPTLAQAYALTGWHTATWGGDPSQQVLGYHSVASTATPTSLPTVMASATPPSAAPSPLMTTPAAGSPTPLSTTTGIRRRPRRTRDTHARRVPRYATSIPTSTFAADTTTPVADVGTTTPTLDVVSTPTAIATSSGAAQPRQTGCHTIRWTTHVGGYPYKHWRIVCH
jgi:3D (Asp-Asp-Asp) domain-containing protein